MLGLDQVLHNAIGTGLFPLNCVFKVFFKAEAVCFIITSYEEEGTSALPVLKTSKGL